jgi:hypothetical protein
MKPRLAFGFYFLVQAFVLLLCIVVSLSCTVNLYAAFQLSPKHLRCFSPFYFVERGVIASRLRRERGELCTREGPTLQRYTTVQPRRTSFAQS